jgi:hypothetical protein
MNPMKSTDNLHDPPDDDSEHLRQALIEQGKALAAVDDALSEWDPRGPLSPPMLRRFKIKRMASILHRIELALSTHLDKSETWNKADLPDKIFMLSAQLELLEASRGPSSAYPDADV